MQIKATVSGKDILRTSDGVEVVAALWRDRACIADENAEMGQPCGRLGQLLLKLNMQFPSNLAIICLGICPREIAMDVPKTFHTGMLGADLLIVSSFLLLLLTNHHRFGRFKKQILILSQL